MDHDLAKPLESDQWIETHNGYAQVLFVAVEWYEEGETIPAGCMPGQEKMTTVIFKRLCDFDGKGRRMVDSCNSRLCNPITSKGRKIVEDLLADPKIRVKFESLTPPLSFGRVVNLRYDLPASDIDAITVAVNHFRATHGTNFLFRMLAQAIPVLAIPAHSVTFDPPPGLVICKLQLMNIMFETRDRQRVYSSLNWSTT